MEKIIAIIIIAVAVGSTCGYILARRANRIKRMTALLGVAYLNKNYPTPNKEEN